MTNALGCDSVVSLDLTVDSIDNTTIQSFDSIFANQNFANYQWLDCNDNYAPILEEINQSFITNVNGNFAVEIIYNSCIDTSECLKVTGVSIANVELYDKIKIYPNPTNDKLFIEYDKEIKTVLKNILGQNILKTTKKEIALKEFSSGIYFIYIYSENNKLISISKVIKK